MQIFELYVPVAALSHQVPVLDQLAFRIQEIQVPFGLSLSHTSHRVVYVCVYREIHIGFMVHLRGSLKSLLESYDNRGQLVALTCGLSVAWRESL